MDKLVLWGLLKSSSGIQNHLVRSPSNSLSVPQKGLRTPLVLVLVLHLVLVLLMEMEFMEPMPLPLPLRSHLTMHLLNLKLKTRVKPMENKLQDNMLE
mmetsp:Transcript_9505/g.17846  ORF Transcript_9505/g.17846 Transcript_9505/m.17846 type:complete len:98 (-) Transcript_9505:35-328(-)